MSIHIKMDATQASSDQTARFHDTGQLVEPVSSTIRFLLLLLCLVGGLSIAYFQVATTRKEPIELEDTFTPSQRALRFLRLILLNAISGILLMMATSIGSQEASLATFEADFHNLVDPKLTQIKIDCFRIHAIRWLQYSSGWQMVTNLAKHAHNLHLWTLPVEFICALVAFLALVVLNGRDQRSKVGLAFSALAHASFPSYWLVWATFASLLLAALREPRRERAPLLPLFETKSRKPSRPVDKSWRNEEGRQLCMATLGLYLLSANFYGFGRRSKLAKDHRLISVQVRERLHLLKTHHEEPVNHMAYIQGESEESWALLTRSFRRAGTLIVTGFEMDLERLYISVSSFPATRGTK